MLDDKPQSLTPEPATDSEASPPEDAVSTTALKAKGPNPVMMMGIVAGVLFVVLMLVIFQPFAKNEAAPADDEEVLKLRAEIEASRAEVNKQLIELGRPPRDGGAESVDEIAARLKKDSDSLIAITRRFQEMLVEQDTAEGSTRSELLRIEQSRQSLIEEVSRLRQELDVAKRTSSDNELVLRQLDAMRAERDSLSSALAETRSKLQSYANVPDTAEFEALQRRLSEAVNAKEFFEKRATELELKLEVEGLGLDGE